jgi:hypothetical protein
MSTYLVIQGHGSEVLQIVKIDVSRAVQSPRTRLIRGAKPSVGGNGCIAVGDGTAHGIVTQKESSSYPSPSPNSHESLVPFRREPGFCDDTIVLPRVRVGDSDIAESGILKFY